MTTTSQQPDPEATDDFVPTDELIRRQGVQPLTSPNNLVSGDPFTSDDEYDDFLEDLYDSRRSGIS